MSESENKDIIETINAEGVKSKIPDFQVGDTVKVHTKIVEGSKERIQVFEGVVLAIKGGRGVNATFTVRKVSFNVGVEKTFLIHSPRIAKIEIVNRGDVRRSKLYYLRDRRGKSARIKTKFQESDKEAQDSKAPKDDNVESKSSTESAQSEEKVAAQTA